MATIHLSKLMPFFVAGAGCAIAVIADLELKKGDWIAGAILYGCCAVPAFYLFKSQEFGLVSVLWSAMLVVVGLLVSGLVLHEPLSIRRLIAAVFALAAIWFVK